MSTNAELKAELELLADNFEAGSLKIGEFVNGVRGVACEVASLAEPLPSASLPVASDAHAVLEQVYGIVVEARLTDAEFVNDVLCELRGRIEEAIGDDVAASIKARIAEEYAGEWGADAADVFDQIEEA